ncbi:MAG TPA: DJ-1/PfpI family protein [Vicinamibacterales bacterium]|nr:DJ-1/PfpI family protein [Vicinamibacterales bacterium]
MRKSTRRQPGTPRRIVFFAIPPVEELDIVGPWEVFASANAAAGRRAYDIQLITAGPTRTIAGDCRLRLLADRQYHEVRGRIDTLLVPGGTGAQRVSDPATIRWLRATAARVRRVASICTGAYALAAAGVLDAREATTHWKFVEDFSIRYPKVTVLPDRIYTRDGRIYTSAGVTAGIDLALALVEDDLGSAVARAAAQALVVFLRRPGGQRQFSETLSSRSSCSTGHERIGQLQVWMAERLAGDLSIQALASRAAMSTRNFARVFTREVGVPPGHHVEQLRVEGARRRLERGEDGVETIAESCGFKSSEVMRRAFLRQLGVPPSEYRERFKGRSAVRATDSPSRSRRP